MGQTGIRSMGLPIWRGLLLICGLALIARRDYLDSSRSINRPPTLAELQAVFSGQVSGALLAAPIPHYEGTIETGQAPAPASAVSTAQLPPKVKGYVDEINVLAAVDQTGAIRGVKILSHRETPAYMKKVLDSGFLDRFLGGNVKDGFDNIDAVTGASITSEAIKKDLAAATGLAANKLYGLQVPTPDIPGWSAALTDPTFIVLIISLATALYGRFGKWPARGRREAAWAISIIGLGFYAMTPFTLVHTSQLLRGDFPGPGNAVLAILAGFVLATTLISGPIYCAYACPFGALQELLHRLPVPKWKVTPRIMSMARELRYIVLFIAVAGAFGLGISAFAEIEPFGHLFRRSRDPVAWLFIMAALGFAVFVKRPWCRFFCPTGACLVMLSSHRRLFKIVERGVDESSIDRPDVQENGAIDKSDL